MKIQRFNSRAEYDHYFCYVVVPFNTDKILKDFHSKKAAQNYIDKECNIYVQVTTRRKAYKLGYKP